MWSGNYTIDALAASGVVYMQDFDKMTAGKKSKIILSMDTGVRYQLTDKRDNKTYYVAKLKDENIWMLDNLALDLTSVSFSNLQGNTNASVVSLSYLKNGGGTSPYPSAAVSTNWQSTYVNPYIVTAYANNNAPTNYGQGNGKIGVYYNYCAVSAGSYCRANGSGIDVTNTLKDSPEDVCPAGWRIPTGGSSGEIQSLYNYYNTTQDPSDPASLQYNLSLPLSGRAANAQQGDVGTYGNWWTSTYYDTNGLYNLLITAAGVRPLDATPRNYGFSVRCLLDD